MVLLSRDARVIADYKRGVGCVLLARKYRCSKQNILRILRRASVRRREGNGKLRRISFTTRQVKRMLRMWAQGHSVWSISTSLKTANSAVARVLREQGVKVVPRLARFGRTKDRIRNTQGYFCVLVDPASPYFCMRLGRTRYVPEHRLVMAKHLKRPLLRSETVHHINGDRGDNAISNLQLVVGNHGKGYALRCRDCGSENVEHVPLERTA